MFSERLGAVYSSLEEKYYSLLDFLDSKGVPVYAYNDFLENRGLPAFPITVALIVLVIALIYGLVFVGNTVNPEITINFSDQFNESVSGVTVSVKDVTGKIIKSPEKIANGESIVLQGIPLGTELTLVAEKNGYQASEKSVVVSKQVFSAAISLEQELTAVEAGIQVLDSKTGDPVRGASVSLEWKGTTKTAVTNGEGKASFPGIPENAEVLIRILADGYETLSSNYSFKGNELKEVNLVASGASLSGISRVVVSVSDDKGSALKGATVRLWDRETDTAIQERTIADSEASFSVEKGTSVRLIVEKEGYLKYDSLEFDESRTVRLDEELWPVVLAEGGTVLSVGVLIGQTPASDATVQLFDVNGNLVATKATGFGGTVEFTGLSSKEFFATAFKQGYLPARQKVNVGIAGSISLALESADTTNSTYVGISVFDSYNAAANNAGISFWERVGEEILPLGIPAVKTDITGYASIVAKPGTTVVAEAKKGAEEGTGEKLVEANKENQIVVVLSRAIGIVELQIVDAEGNPVKGYATIETIAGALLFDGNIESGSIFFDAEGNKDVIAYIEAEDGSTFSERVSVEGLETVQLKLGNAATGIAPVVKFLGVLDEFSNQTEGISPEKDYWLSFEATWPSGVEKGGIHVRVGSDSIAFVDSQEFGITGFEATTANYFYGKSYQPLPSPGNESADKQNSGSPGQLNKVVELYFTSPANTTPFRIRVKANKSIAAQEIEFHFRGWSQAGGKIFRYPADSELGEELFSSAKTAFYAADEKAIVKVFQSDAACAEDLCGNYFFILPNGLYVERQAFTAITEELYALEIDLSSKKAMNVTLKLDTDKASPKIMFTGYDVDTFADSPEGETEILSLQSDISGQGYLDWPAGSEAAQSSGNPLGFAQGGESTSLTVSGLGVSPERQRKIRVYFKGIDEGTTEIKMQAASTSVLNESFSFEVERNKQLLVTVSPGEIGIGEPFTVKVLDFETGDAVQNATVQIKDSKSSLADSIAGTGSTKRGLGGEYYFKNSLDPGIYSAEISAAGYKSEKLELTITRNDLLVIKSPITIDISKETGEKSASVGINNSGKQEIKSLSYEIEKDADFPEEFSVSVSLPSTIGANQDATATIRVIVNLNEESEDNLYGEAELSVKGMVAGNYPTKTKSTLKINYNKKLDEACLYFDKPYLEIKLIGSAGMSATEEIEVENRCGTALILKASVEGMESDPNLTVTVSPLTIQKDAVEKTKVTITNKIERIYDLQSTKQFKIRFESSQIAKTIPLSVEIWNPRTNLSYPANIALWMVRSAAEELAYAESPIQVMNNGSLPITAFRAAVTPEAYMQGITTGIKPSIYEDYGNGYNQYSTGYGTYGNYGTGYDGYGNNGNYGTGYSGYGNNYAYNDYSGSYGTGGITLQPGMPLTPQRYVYAETKRTDAMQQPGQGWIVFTGVVSGRQFALGRTSLGVNYSGTKCLKASAVDSMEFSSKEASEGTLERTIKVRNECSQPVRISGAVKPEKIGGNSFIVSPANFDLPAGSEQQMKLILLKGQEASRSDAIRIVGLLVSQGVWIESNEITVTLKLGELAATADGKKTAEIAIKECGTDNTTQMAFPLLSSDCGAGYCDAKQLAAYITAKMNTFVKMAEEKARRAEYKTEKLGACINTEKPCRFSDMGIISADFPVYLQLDYMTDAVLESAMDKSTELKGYQATEQEKNIGDIGSIGFEFGEVYIGGTFKGCGKYIVSIKGAVRVRNNEIIMQDGGKNFILAVNTNQVGAATNECQNLIQNAANFLPVDEGYTMTQSYQAWPGFVKAGQDLESLGEAFAKELFGKSEGRASSVIGANTNKIEIVKGDPGAGLIKISLPKLGTSNEPKTITATVISTYSSTDKEMTSTLAKALKNFKNGNFSEGDCYGQDDKGQYIVMKTGTDFDKLYGKLEIKGADKIKISNNLQCVDLVASSKLNERINLETDFLRPGTNASKDGITFVEIQDSKGFTILKENANGSRERAKSLALAPEKGTTGLYSAKFKFCVQGDNLFPKAIENIKAISITATSEAQRNRKTEPYKIAVEACGLHPYDLVKQMAKVDLKEINAAPDKKFLAYATVSWLGEPDSISLSQVQNDIAAEAAIDEARKRYGTGTDVHAAEQRAYLAEVADRRIAGTLWYMSVCSIAAVGANWWNGSTKAAFYDIPFNCVGPGVWAMKNIVKDYGGNWEEFAEGVDYGVRKVLGFIPLIGDWLANKVVPEGDTISNYPTEEQAMEEAGGWNGFKETILAPALTGVTAKELYSAVSNGGEVVGEASAKAAANEITDTIVQDMVKENLGKMTKENLASYLGGEYIDGKFVKGSYVGGAFAPDNRIVGLRETLYGKLNSNLLEQKGKMQIGKAITDEKLKIIDNSVLETSQDMASYAAKHTDDFAGNAGKVAVSQRNNAARNILDPSKVESTRNIGSTVEFDPRRTDLVTEKVFLLDSWEGKVLDDIKLQLSATDEGQKLLADKKFMNEVKKIVSKNKDAIGNTINKNPVKGTSAWVTHKVDLDGVARITRQTAEETQVQAVKAYTRGVFGQNNAETFVKQLFDGDDAKKLVNVTDDVVGDVRPGLVPGASRNSRFMDSVQTFFSGRFWNWDNMMNVFKNLGKGLIMDAFEVGLGYYAWDQYWEDAKDAPVGGAVVTNVAAEVCTDADADGKCTETDYELLQNATIYRGYTYLIEVKIDLMDNKYNNLTRLEKTEDFELMNQRIAEKKAVLWEEPGCKNFLTKGIGLGYLGNLSPVPSKAVGAEFVLAYYNYNSLFAGAARGDASVGAYVPEDWIAAAVFVSPERIPTCGIQEKWYNREAGETEDVVKSRVKADLDCAANQLRLAVGRAGSGVGFRKVAEAMVSKQTDIGNYVNLAVQAQATWQKFRVNVAS